MNDDDDKLIIVPNGKSYTDSEIRLLTDFQEMYYESTIIRNDIISSSTNSKLLSPTIETSRLILRRYKESDIDMQYEILQDKRLQEYVKMPDLTKAEELDCIRKWIKEADTSKYEKWVIELKDTNIPIGNISVNGIDKRNNYCNVGYVIKYDYWGNWYASEALNAVSNYLLEHRKYYLVECSCNELNIASSKVMLKAGFKKDGYIENRRLNQDGTYSKVEYYSKGI